TGCRIISIIQTEYSILRSLFDCHNVNRSDISPDIGNCNTSGQLSVIVRPILFYMFVSTSSEKSPHTSVSPLSFALSDCSDLSACLNSASSFIIRSVHPSPPYTFLRLYRSDFGRSD